MFSFGFEIVKGSGNVVEKDFDVSGFKEVKLSGIGSLHIEQGETESLRVEAEDNLIPHLRIEVRQSQLILGVERGVNLRPRKPLRFFLNARVLEEIKISGHGDIFTSNIKSKKLALLVSGSGDIEASDLDIEEDAYIKIGGSGNISVDELHASELEAVISGSGRIKAEEVSCHPGPTAHQRFRKGDLP